MRYLITSFLIFAVFFSASCVKNYCLLLPEQRMEKQINDLYAYYKTEDNNLERYNTLLLFFYNNKNSRYFTKKQQAKVLFWMGSISLELAKALFHKNNANTLSYYVKAYMHFSNAAEKLTHGSFKQVWIYDIEEKIFNLAMEIYAMNMKKNSLQFVHAHIDEIMQRVGRQFERKKKIQSCLAMPGR